jgi:hypothetical protein
MMVTALNKMCHSQRLELSWAGVLVQTTQVPKDAVRLTANLAATESLLAPLGAPARGAGKETRIWKGVNGSMVGSFIEGLQFPAESARASGMQLAAFIRQQATKDYAELTSWTVALVSVQDAKQTRSIAGNNVGLAYRAYEQMFPTSYSLKKSRIVNPADEAHDFQEVPFDQDWFDEVRDKPELAADVDWLNGQIGNNAATVALELTKRWQNSNPPKIKPPVKGETARPNGRVLRVLRPRTHGLLIIYPLDPLAENGVDPNGPPIIGVALSFPTSDTVIRVEYRVNRVWDAQMQEDAEYDD